MPKKHPSPKLPMRGGTGKGRKRQPVLTVSIFKRPESQFYQASVRMPGGERKRITTRTTMAEAAKDFAELAYRHFRRLQETQPGCQPQTQELTFTFNQ